MPATEQSSQLDLIGVGFGRTGTDSTRHALNRLGYPCYHMFEVLNRRKNPGHMDFWIEVAESEPGVQHDWNRVFANYRATVDNPAACVWRELIQANPEAKVLLTLHPRGAEAWYDSTWNTIYLPQRTWQHRLLSKVLPPARKMNRMVQLIWQRFHKGTMPDRDRSIARYEEHRREVEAFVPPERLLVFKASDGWEPLCAFLDEPVPNEPFPRTNERQVMERRLRRLGALGYAVLLAPLIVIGLVAWLLFF